MGESLPVKERQDRSAVYIGIILVVIAGILVAAYMSVRPKPSAQAGRVIGFTPPPPAAAPLHVVILSGGSTGCHGFDGCGSNNYALLLSAREGWSTTVLFERHTGYLAGVRSKPESNFSARLPAVIAAKPDLVIVEGSKEDETVRSPVLIQRAAYLLYEAIHRYLPKTKIVVIGPVWGDSPPASILQDESALKNAASMAKVSLFVDPIAEAWFSGSSASMISAPGEAPNNAGHIRMARLIQNDLSVLHLNP